MCATVVGVGTRVTDVAARVVGVGARVTDVGARVVGVGARVAVWYCMAHNVWVKGCVGARVAGCQCCNTTVDGKQVIRGRVAVHQCTVHKVWVQKGYSVGARVTNTGVRVTNACTRVAACHCMLHNAWYTICCC